MCRIQGGWRLQGSTKCSVLVFILERRVELEVISNILNGVILLV